MSFIGIYCCAEHQGKCAIVTEQYDLEHFLTVARDGLPVRVHDGQAWTTWWLTGTHFECRSVGCNGYRMVTVRNCAVEGTPPKWRTKHICVRNMVWSYRSKSWHAFPPCHRAGCPGTRRRSNRG